MKFSLDRATVERRPSHNEATPYQERVMAQLPDLLPQGAAMTPLASGSLLITHAGKTCGIDLASRGRLSDLVVKTMQQLRAAGMRFEVARSASEAFELIKQMGIPLKAREESPYAARAMFREEIRRGRR